jgi:hypothetical protein
MNRESKGKFIMATLLDSAGVAHYDIMSLKNWGVIKHSCDALVGMVKQYSEGEKGRIEAKAAACLVQIKALKGAGLSLTAIKAAVVGRPYQIKFGGALSMQFVDDTAKTFIACAESGKKGARVYNIRGAVVTVDEVISSIEAVYPRARGLISCTPNSLGIAANLAEEGLRDEIGRVPATVLSEGIQRTVEIFEKLQREGRLDLADLEFGSRSVTGAGIFAAEVIADDRRGEPFVGDHAVLDGVAEVDKFAVRHLAKHGSANE